MPASERPDVETSVDTHPELPEIDRLESAVRHLLAELAELRERTRRAEAAYDELHGALETAGSGAGENAAELEERLEGLAAENRRLHALLEKARERAERIRSRLMVVEDEL